MVTQTNAGSRNSSVEMIYQGLLTLLAAISVASAVPDTREWRLAVATNDVAFELLRSYRAEKNVLISPFSISTSLAMVYLGADGTTAQVLRDVLGYSKYGLNEQDVHAAFHSLTERLKRNTRDYQLTSVNTVLVEKDFSVLPTYGQALKTYYAAEVDSVDFASQGEDIRNKINHNVDDATRGKIQNFLENPPSSDTKLFLLNAVYFLGNWKNPFNSNFTYERPFYNNGVHEKNVPMMHRDGQYQYAISEELSASVVVLPYKGDNGASMMIVLPDDRKGLALVQEKLTLELMDKILDSTAERRLQIIVPKFSIGFSEKLMDPLVRLGLGELFSNEANLTRIAGNQHGLKVSSVLHKAVIDVNERGSEAAAATGIEIVPLSIPPRFHVDHPFLFFVRDERSGVILFSGKVDEL